MQLPPPYLPEFIPQSGITEEKGKQDKIEIEIEGFQAWGANTDEIDAILNYLGAPPPVYQGNKRTRTRQNHGINYGWIFNTIDTRKWNAERTVQIRKTPLKIEQSGKETPSLIPPPLFSGFCKWTVEEDADKPLTPLKLTGKLVLSINPTRFLLHRPKDENLPKGILKRNARPHSIDEASYDKEDNWLPISGTYRVTPTPEEWQEGLSRYLKKIVQSVGNELKRACSQVGNDCKIDALKFNVKKVETYWEFASEDSTGLVRDLEMHIRTFSRNYRGMRTYDTVNSGIDGDMPILEIQTAIGEWLKIYAKTKRRIRIEVTHLLTGDERFQFPREYASIGEAHRSNQHTFSSKAGVLSFLDRLRERAAKVVDKFLRHVAEQSRVISSPVSSDQALLDIAWALQNYRNAARPITSLLINNQCISMAQWPDAWQRAIDSLREKGIIRMVEDQKVYRIADRYRSAVAQLKKLGCFPVLENKPAPPQANGGLNSEGNKVRVRHRVVRKRRRISPL